MTGQTLRVLLVDDDALVRSGLRVILGGERDIDVVGDAGTGAEAIAVAERTDPDVVLMDVRMPDMDGIDATTALVARDPGRPRILVLTTFEDRDYLYRALAAGASGFVLKRATPEELLHAIRTVASGSSLVLPGMTRDLIASRQRSTRHRAVLANLTAREADVLRLLAFGLSNGEIADRLFLSRETVKTHVSSVLVKLEARDRTQAVIAAYDSGFISDT